MYSPKIQRLIGLALALTGLGATLAQPAVAQAAAGLAASSSADAAPAVAAAASRSGAAEWRSRHSLYYQRNWGVDIIGVKPVSSGYMLSFRYRILDPVKARILNDRKAKAYLIDEASGTALAVPAMENIGELRAGTTPQADRVYFMIFGNPGRLVQSGAKVTIVAGAFRIEGLVVD
jgi:hypothetical protein